MFKDKKIYRFAAVISVFMLFALLVFMFSRMYIMAKENVVNTTCLDMNEQTRDIDYILQQSISELSLTADMVEYMLKDERTESEIKSYLVSESAKTEAVFEGNTTGVYAYVRNEYIDGTGWIPDSSYDPKTRPWYTEAIGGDGDIVLVDPYVDAQTNNVVMTVTKLLEDKKSVVAFDVYLYPMQEKAEMTSTKVNADVIVLTDSRYIVASSVTSEIGNFLDDSSDERIMALNEKYRTHIDKDYFKFRHDRTKYIAFNKKSYSDWRVLIFMREQDIISRVSYLYMGFSNVFLFVAVLAGFIIYSINRRRKSAEELSKQFQSLADIYMSMYKLDFVNGECEVIKEDKYIGNLVREAPNRPIEMLCEVVPRMTVGGIGSKSLTKLDVIEQMQNMDSADVMTHEYETANGWIRDRFIVVDKKDDHVRSALWLIEDIDEEKKREKYLESEVLRDEMTGLYNRKAYEQKLRSYDGIMPEEDVVYIIMDVNGLKVTNDNCGHIVGDELLRGAADCINQCFGCYGRVYRTGGDEFVAIINSDEAELLRTRRSFDEIVEEWRGSMNNKLSISFGCAAAYEFPDKSIAELAKLADERMYQNKDLYYLNMGIERKRGLAERA